MVMRCKPTLRSNSVTRAMITDYSASLKDVGRNLRRGEDRCPDIQMDAIQRRKMWCAVGDPPTAIPRGNIVGVDLDHQSCIELVGKRDLHRPDPMIDLLAHRLAFGVTDICPAASR